MCHASSSDNDAAVGAIARAIIAEMKASGVFFITKKEWMDVRKSLVALAEEMAHNTVRIGDMYDIINADSTDKT